jgi:EmrB/QacA subfamily drug resistance transporter
MTARRVSMIVASAAFLQLLDATIIATSLPTMARELGVEPIEMSIGITSYMLSAAVFMPIAGWLSDRFGPVRTFLIAIALFTGASAACGFAQDLAQFVGARLVQGIGGAFMIPVGRLIVLNNAKKSQVIEMLTLITWPALMAPVIGPVLGGAITSYFSWRWNFWMNVPLGLAGLVLVLAFVRETGTRLPRRLDWVGFILAGVSLALLLVGVESFVHLSGLWPVSSGIVAAGVVLGTIAIRHLRSTPDPIVDIAVFRHPTFALSNLTGGSLVRLAVHTMPFLLPVMFQVGFALARSTAARC